MKLYNTLTKKIEEFKPYDSNEVTLYTCGPTVYHFAHIGNLRTYVFEDVLEKGLKYVGYNVKRCMNITDVGHMSSDADKLNIKKPEITVKASDNIDFYIKIIERLLENGYAYIANGNVYFDISKIQDYYQLSGKKPLELVIGARDDVDEDIHKKNPYDFGLWFTVSKFQNQEIKWDSPWGLGYPGWHIECSGIAIKYLGEHLDIHCGGVDNIFPHHTNEIAQSEAYLGHEWCHYWLHGEHLNDATGKMSKSKGDFLTVSLLESKGYHTLAYRFFCLQSHYRNQLVFSYDALDIANNTYSKLKNKIKNIKENANGEVDEKIVDSYLDKFKEAINNDLNTSLMLTCLYDILKENVNNNTKLKVIESYDQVLSLDLLEEKTKEIDQETINYIEEQIAKRNLAKNNKDYELADKIRKELAEKNIIIKDTREGTIYEVR